ncbi:TcaA 3rd/4th domain-containing protein [Thermoflavimicrobium daqui]|uniref:Uncharacterized protein n=1 Tax=Thermoflavimicrobium daqui TaxID=2137476 RepID=A0A364K1J9_9BACL|nr:hypothetical protein [Thermoflavimicrobium daqui]RAL21902.1 hypothetical protein DL897_15930 [Thermoflavimicrobium daqui]
MNTEEIKRKFPNEFPLLLKNKKWPWIILGVIVIGIIYLIGWFSVSKPEDITKDFIEAIQQGDIDKLEDLLTVENNQLSLEKKHLQHLINYCRSNPKYYNLLIESLNFQVSGTVPFSLSSDNTLNQNQVNYLSNFDIYLKKHERILFYDNYSLVLRPYKMMIQVTEPDVIIKVDGKEVFKSTTNNNIYTSKPLLPGTYEIKAEKDYPLVKLTKTEMASLYGWQNQFYGKKIELDKESIRLKSGVPGTEVYVNGKSINQTIHDDIYKLEPVSLDGNTKVQGVYEFPWGKGKSKEIILSENDNQVDITPNPIVSNELQTQLVELTNKFAKELTQARNEKNADYLTTTDDKMKSIISSSLSFSSYELELLGTRIDLDNATYEQVGTSKYKVILPVEFHQINKSNEEFNTYLISYSYDSSTKSWIVSHTEAHLPVDEFKGNNVVKTEFK